MHFISLIYTTGTKPSWPLEHWTDGGARDHRMGWSNWCGGEPNSGGGEACTEITENRCWNDVDCGAARGYVCEKDKRKGPQPEETTQL